MSEKPIIAIVSIAITTLLTSFHAGVSYLGSGMGTMVYLLSVSFLIVFVAVNIIYRQKIEDLSKGKVYFICIAYLSAIPLIYLINSLKPASIFLICLFYLYFFLALMWTIIAEKMRLTEVCIILFILCLLPLTFGLCVHWTYENPICDEIKYLESQNEYYENHLSDLNYGALTQHLTDSAKTDVRELEENIEEAEKHLLVADFSGARKKIKAANKNNNDLKRIFELLDPKNYLFDELHRLDEELVQLHSRASNTYANVEKSDARFRTEKPGYIMSRINNTEHTYKIKRTLSDVNVTKNEINATKNKADEAWDLYRSGSYEETYECTVQINRDISDIEERLDRSNIITEMKTEGTTGFETIFAIAGLLAVAYLMRRKK